MNMMMMIDTCTQQIESLSLYPNQQFHSLQIVSLQTMAINSYDEVFMGISDGRVLTFKSEIAILEQIVKEPETFVPQLDIFAPLL